MRFAVLTAPFQSKLIAIESPGFYTPPFFDGGHIFISMPTDIKNTYSATANGMNPSH